MTTTTRTRGRGRGFASMPKDRIREIASLGGKAAWESGRAHRWTPEDAAKAGKVGGARSKRTKKGVKNMDN